MATVDEVLIDGIPRELGEAENADLITYIAGKLDYWLGQSNVVGLPYRQARLDSIDFLISAYKSKVDYKEGNQEVKASGIVSNLLKLREAALKDLEMCMGVAGGNRGGAVGLLTHKAPVEVGTLCLDPNDRAYRGDALRRSGRLI